MSAAQSSLAKLAEQFDSLRDMEDRGLSYHNDYNRTELNVYGKRAIFLYRILDELGPEIAAALRKADTTDETGWLIEWPENELYTLRWYAPGKPFVRDASQALRFARKEDAEAFMRKGEAVSMIGCAKAVEHAWIAPSVCRASRGEPA